MCTAPKPIDAAKQRAAVKRWGTRRKRCDCKVMTLKRAKARGRSKEHQAFCPFYKGDDGRKKVIV